MNIDGWKYYNHAAIPNTAPHEPVNIAPINDGSIWKMWGNTPLLARWTSEWDCGYATNFWYVIKDTPFDIGALKSKRRYEVNKGRKNFQVKRIDPEVYSKEIFDVAEKAFAEYPEKYRPILNRECFINDVLENWKDYSVFGEFNTYGKFCGYAYLIDHTDYSELSVLKTVPKEEKNGSNAALVDGICRDYESKLKNGNFYICDGARAIRHQTNFQDYLEKYFVFRKAYCHIHIKYRWYIQIIVKLLYPFCRILSRSDSRIAWNIASLIEMDKLSRN